MNPPTQKDHLNGLVRVLPTGQLACQLPTGCQLIIHTEQRLTSIFQLAEVQLAKRSAN